LAPHGLAISSGDTKSVGVGGLTLIGGIGWKVRKYGLALDNVVAVEMVTAHGDVVHASAEENPELFWAIRGGGGNFGIVTAFEFVAHPTTDVFFGKIAFPAAETAAVLQGWANYLRTAPEELTSTAEFANPFAGGPDAPLEIHVAFDSDNAELAANAIDPIRRLSTVLDDDVVRKPYAETLADGATLPPGIQIVTRNAFVETESVSDVLQILAEVGASGRSPFIAIRSVGGAVARVPDDATAYAHRRAELMFVTTIAGPTPVIEAARPGLDAVWQRLAPHVNGAYANFLASATEGDVAAIYPTRTYQRLAAVKRQYDPGNLFAHNHNVRPQAA
jgi:FAD/FMN-containing dehydrogenase